MTSCWPSGSAAAPPTRAPTRFWDRIEDAGGDHIRLVRWSTPEELEQKLLEQLKSELDLADLDDENRFEMSIGGEPYGAAVYFWERR